MKNSEEVRFVYVMGYRPSLRNENVRPLTIAYRFNDEKKVIEYNSAMCSEKDQFVKATGRMKAQKRLEAVEVPGRLGLAKPNGIIDYSEVSDESGNPKYNLIAQKLHSLFV